MPNPSTLKKLLLLILLALYLTACDNTCVEADEFSIVPVALESNMKKMKVGVFGSYNHDSGGQYSEWYDTGLRTNGEKLTIYITGGWIFSAGSPTASQEDVDLVPLCTYCSKDITDSNPRQNCICHNTAGQTPQAEILETGENASCSSHSDYIDPDKCTCFNRGNNYVSRYGVYHQIRNSLKKSPYNEGREALMGQKQTNCRLTRGMGAYISLWGTNGAQVPTRAYHLFSEEEYCPVPRGSNGECMRNGKDVTRHVYRSPNDLIFIKDDGLQNNLPTASTSTPGFQYHGPNEVVKVMMYDGYYDDNAGKYDLYFSGGFGGDSTSFILEFITGLFEDILLGKVNTEGVRTGGVIEFMYSSTVNYPVFQIALKLCLTLYIVFFGASYLMGVVDITRKEVSMIIFKLALVIMFTSAGSWGVYKLFVVNFFKDGMDSLMGMVMMSTDNAVGDSSNINFIAQGGRGIDSSNATRFSYPDLIIKKLLSSSVAKKLLGAVGDSVGAGNIFGIFYFPLVYALIFYFIYVMLLICSIYIVSMTKMLFLLALGPIFIVLALFSKTNEMFKSWIAFLGSRALEMTLLFLVLSPFLITIDRYFTDLLYFKVCGVQKGIPPVYITVLQTTGLNRSLFEWLLMILKIAVIIFIMQNVIDRVSYIAGTLINIGGIPNQDTTSRTGYGESGFGLAMGAVNSALGLAISGAKSAASFAATNGATPALKLATAIARKTGVADAWNAIGKKIPFRGPRTRMRDNVIKSAIDQARQEGISEGLSGKDLDRYTRQKAIENLTNRIANEPGRMALLGVDAKNISKVMDRILIRDAMKDHLKEKAQEFKEQGLIGKEMRQALREEAQKWARDNVYDKNGETKVKNLLKDSSIKSFVRSQAEYSSSEAAEIFDRYSDRQKYLEHLQDNKMRNQRKWEEAKKNPITKMAPYLLSRAKHEIMGDAKGNPNLMRKNFDRKAHLEDNPREGLRKYNPLSYVNFLDKRLYPSQHKETTELHDRILQRGLANRLASDEKGITSITSGDKKIDRKEKLKEIGKRDMMQSELRDLAKKEVDRNIGELSVDKEDLPLAKLNMANQILQDMFIDDGRTLFEKAVQHDYLTGKKGEDSMEFKVTQALSNQLDEYREKTSELSLSELVKEREKFKDSSLNQGMFANKLDPSQIKFLATSFGNLDQNDFSSTSPDKSKKSDNAWLLDYERKLKEDLGKTSKDLDHLISDQAIVLDNQLDEIESDQDQLEVSKVNSQKKKIVKKYNKSVRDLSRQIQDLGGLDLDDQDKQYLRDLARSSNYSSFRKDDSKDQLSRKIDVEKLTEIANKIGASNPSKADKIMDAVTEIARQEEVYAKQFQVIAKPFDYKPVGKSSPERSATEVLDRARNLRDSHVENYQKLTQGKDAVDKQLFLKQFDQDYKKIQSSGDFDVRDLKTLQSRIKSEEAFISGSSKLYLGMSTELQPMFKSQQSYAVSKAYQESLKDLSKAIDQGASSQEISIKAQQLNEMRGDLIRSYNPLAKFIENHDRLTAISGIDQISSLQDQGSSASPIAREAPKYRATGNSSSQLDNILATTHAYDISDLRNPSRYEKLLSNDLRKVQEIAKQIDKQDSKLSDQFKANKENVQELERELRTGLKLLKSNLDDPDVKDQLEANNQKIKELQSKVFSRDSIPELRLLSKTAVVDAKEDIKILSPEIYKLFDDKVFVPNTIILQQELKENLTALQAIQKNINLATNQTEIDSKSSLAHDLREFKQLLQANIDDIQTGKTKDQDVQKIYQELENKKLDLLENHLFKIADVVRSSNSDVFVKDSEAGKVSSSQSSIKTDLSLPPKKPLPKIPEKKPAPPVLPDQAVPKKDPSPDESRRNFLDQDKLKLENAGKFIDSPSLEDSKKPLFLAPPPINFGNFQARDYSANNPNREQTGVIETMLSQDIATINRINSHVDRVKQSAKIDHPELKTDSKELISTMKKMLDEIKEIKDDTSLDQSSKQALIREISDTIRDQKTAFVEKHQGSIKQVQVQSNSINQASIDLPSRPVEKPDFSKMLSPQASQDSTRGDDKSVNPSDVKIEFDSPSRPVEKPDLSKIDLSQERISANNPYQPKLVDDIDSFKKIINSELQDLAFSKKAINYSDISLSAVDYYSQSTSTIDSSQKEQFKQDLGKYTATLDLAQQKLAEIETQKTLQGLTEFSLVQKSQIKEVINEVAIARDQFVESNKDQLVQNSSVGYSSSYDWGINKTPIKTDLSLPPKKPSPKVPEKKPDLPVSPDQAVLKKDPLPDESRRNFLDQDKLKLENAGNFKEPDQLKLDSYRAPNTQQIPEKSPNDLLKNLQIDLSNVQKIINNLNSLSSLSEDQVKLKSELALFEDRMQDRIDRYKDSALQTSSADKISSQDLVLSSKQTKEEFRDIVKRYQPIIRQIEAEEIKSVIIRTANDKSLDHLQKGLMRGLESSTSFDQLKDQSLPEGKFKTKQSLAQERISQVKDDFALSINNVLDLMKDSSSQERKDLIQEQRKLNRLFDIAKDEIKTDINSIAIDQIFREIDRTKQNVAEKSIAIVESYGDDAKAQEVRNIMAIYQSKDSNPIKELSDLVYENRQTSFAENLPIIAQRVAKENITTTLLTEIATVQAVEYEDKNAVKLAKELSAIAVEEKQLIVDLNKLSKAQDQSGFSYMKIQGVSDRYDQIVERRLQAIDQFHQSKTSIAQSSPVVEDAKTIPEEISMRANPYTPREVEKYSDQSYVSQNSSPLAQSNEKVLEQTKKPDQAKTTESSTQDQTSYASTQSESSISKLISDQSNQPIKEESLARFNSMQEEVKTLNNKFDEVLADRLVQGDKDLVSYKTELNLQHQKLDTLYEIAQLQIDKGQSLSSLDQTVKQIAVEQESYKTTAENILAKIPDDAISQVDGKLIDKSSFSDQLKSISSSTIKDDAVDLLLSKPTQQYFAESLPISTADQSSSPVKSVIYSQENLELQQSPQIKPYLVAQSSDFSIQSMDAKMHEYGILSTKEKVKELRDEIWKSQGDTDDSRLKSMISSSADVVDLASQKSQVIVTNLKVEFGAEISKALISGSFTDVLLKGGLPMIGGEYYQSAENKNLSEVKDLESKKKMQKLNLKMDKINMKMLEHQIMKDVDSGGEDKHEIQEKKTKLEKLKQRNVMNKRILSKIDEKLESGD